MSVTLIIEDADSAEPPQSMMLALGSTVTLRRSSNGCDVLVKPGPSSPAVDAAVSASMQNKSTRAILGGLAKALLAVAAVEADDGKTYAVLRIEEGYRNAIANGLLFVAMGETGDVPDLSMPKGAEPYAALAPITETINGPSDGARPSGHVWRVGRAMRRALALLPLVALAACQPDHAAARNWLLDRGYTRIELYEIPFFASPCLWHEGYAIGFRGSADGKRWQGVLCASTEGLSDGHVPEQPRQVGSARPWDFLESAR